MNLFLFAHQDDEYGVYPVLEHLVARNEPLQVVYLTSGTFSGLPSEQRNKESIRVLSRIGLSPAQIHFPGAELGFPDGQLHKHTVRASGSVLALLKDAATPTRIFTPAWESGHQDHDATHLIGCFLAQQYGCLEASRQFPLYHGLNLPWILWHTFSPLPGNGTPESFDIKWRQRFRCLAYCLQYRSQWRTWAGLYPLYAINILTVGRQYLQPLKLERLKQPPHAGTCLYERRGFCTREQFVYHTRDLIGKIST